jgi:hypothetical protein
LLVFTALVACLLAALVGGLRRRWRGRGA